MGMMQDKKIGEESFQYCKINVQCSMFNSQFSILG